MSIKTLFSQANSILDFIRHGLPYVLAKDIRIDFLNKSITVKLWDNNEWHYVVISETEILNWTDQEILYDVINKFKKLFNG